MQRSNRKKSKSRRNSRQPSLAGSLLLELVAAVGFMMLLAVSQGRATPNEKAVSNQNAVADRTAEYGTLVTGFLSDQIDRQEFFARR